MIQQIPFPDFPAWQEDIALDGNVYTLAARWNTRSKSWGFSISTVDGDPLITSIRLIQSWPLLFGYRYVDRIPPGEFLIICLTAGCVHDPGRFDFRDGNFRLLYVPEADL